MSCKQCLISLEYNFVRNVQSDMLKTSNCLIFLFCFKLRRKEKQKNKTTTWASWSAGGALLLCSGKIFTKATTMFNIDHILATGRKKTMIRSINLLPVVAVFKNTFFSLCNLIVFAQKRVICCLFIFSVLPFSHILIRDKGVYLIQKTGFKMGHRGQCYSTWSAFRLCM